MRLSHTTPFAAAAAVVVLSLSAAESRGQAAFDPEISVVESGTKLDVQATVSADRKYVTMTTRLQSAQLISLRDFIFQSGGGGMVGFGGGVNAGGNGNGGVGGTAAGTVARSGGPVSQAGPGNAKPAANGGRGGPLMPAFARPAPAEPTPVLFREGMTRVDAPAAPTTPAAVATPLPAAPSPAAPTVANPAVGPSRNARPAGSR